MTSSLTSLLRSCGECQACCTPLAIPEIEKPPGVRCKHLVAHGCGIYETRPEACKIYYCAWRRGIIGDTEDRPDKIGILLTVRENRLDTGIPGLPPFSCMAHETRRNAYQELGATSLLANAVHSGVLVFLTRGQQAPLVAGAAELRHRVAQWCTDHGKTTMLAILADAESWGID